MKIFKGFNIPKNYYNSIILIGNFDGVHLGHQKLFKRARQYRKKFKCKIGVITFTPMPKMFFNKKLKHFKLMNLSQKIKQFEKQKVDFLINQKFSKSFSKIRPELFIKNYLYKKIKTKVLFVSSNFRFGNKRQGDTKLLKYYEKQCNYKLIIPSPLKKNHKIISSTKIRILLSKGNLKKANDFDNNQNGDSRNWAFDLHEAYMVYNGKSSANGLDYVIGRFEPFWTQSNFSWNPYQAFEGAVIGGELKDYRFVTGWMDDNNASTMSEITFLQATSDSLVFGLPGTFGWTENAGGKVGSIASTLNLINKDLNITYLWDAASQNSGDSSYEIKTNINLLDGWDGSIAWRKTGVTSNMFGSFRNNVDYLSLGLSRQAADNEKMSWVLDWGNESGNNDNNWQLSWNVKGSF